MSDYQYLSSQQVVHSPQYPFTKGQLNHYLIHRHKNGLDAAVRKIGNRLYFRKDLFDAWIESHSKEGGIS